MGYVLIGAAGIIGALLRFYTGLFVSFWWLGAFPLGTFLTNLLGCFLLGGFTTRIDKIKSIHPQIKTALGTGLIGSFTTFSTFSVETVQLINKGHHVLALIYILASMIGGLIFAAIGYIFGYYLSEKRGIKKREV